MAPSPLPRTTAACASATIAATAVLLFAAAPARAAPDPGRRLWLQCQSCHSLAAGEPNKVGPNLHGIIGAKAASRPGYAYSPALAKSGLVWTDETLDRWLLKPEAVVAGTKMLYAGMPQASDRAAVIAYMKAAAR